MPEQRRTRTFRFWAGLVTLTALVIVVCVLAARWQWSRYLHRQAEIARIEANYSSHPLPLNELLDGSSGSLSLNKEWHPATVTGHYVNQVVLRNRKVNGQATFRMLGLLQLPDGKILVVDRGWVAPDSQGNVPATLPAPPTSELHLTVRLRPLEREVSAGAPAGQVQSITPKTVLAAADMAGELVGAYGIAVDTGTLGAYPPPDLDPRSHLSYTFQWYVFAAGTVVWAVIHARRELRADAGIPTTPRPRRRGIDEEFEDSLS